VVAHHYIYLFSMTRICEINYMIINVFIENGVIHVTGLNSNLFTCTLYCIRVHGLWLECVRHRSWNDNNEGCLNLDLNIMSIIVWNVCLYNYDVDPALLHQNAQARVIKTSILWWHWSALPKHFIFHIKSLHLHVVK